MTQTLTVAETLTGIHCAQCGVLFGITTGFRKSRESDRQSFHCPNGHSQRFPGKTDEKRAKEAEAQLEAAQRTTKWLREELGQTRTEKEAAKRSAAAYKGALTKARKRVGKGTCPECKRHFPALREHMASQHPEHATKDTP